MFWPIYFLGVYQFCGALASLSNIIEKKRNFDKEKADRVEKPEVTQYILEIEKLQSVTLSGFFLWFFHIAFNNLCKVSDNLWAPFAIIVEGLFYYAFYRGYSNIQSHLDVLPERLKNVALIPQLLIKEFQQLWQQHVVKNIPKEVVDSPSKLAWLYRLIKASPLGKVAAVPSAAPVSDEKKLL